MKIHWKIQKKNIIEKFIENSLNSWEIVHIDNNVLLSTYDITYCNTSSDNNSRDIWNKILIYKINIIFL